VNHLTLSIESDLHDVSLVAVSINAVCRQLGLDEQAAHEAELCVVEATTNAVRHAYQCQPGHMVNVEVTEVGNFLHFEISDHGTPMPARQVQRLIQGDTAIEEDTTRAALQESGRGLQIIHDLMDEITYFTHNGTNRLTMKKQLPPTSHT
jgi:serine/threonine-protein kinase RsbW